MLDVTRLRVLVAVARYGSVTAAARALNYAQPSVSHHLARLEAETGIKLIQRAGRGIRLTDAGRLLAERGAEVIGRLDAAESELAAYTGLRAGRLRLAAFPSALGTIVPAAAAVLRGRQPSIDLRLTEAEPPEALRMLRAGYVDVALVFRYSPDDPGPDAGMVGEGTDGPAVHGGAAGHRAATVFGTGGFADDEDSAIDITEGLRERLILDEPIHLVTSAHGAEQAPAELSRYARLTAGSPAAIAAGPTCSGSARRPASPRRSRSPPTTTWRSRRWWPPTWASRPCPRCACGPRGTPGSRRRR
jgi:DNA-binding transcriptional LysR family regulator